jgi:hypothetical protein
LITCCIRYVVNLEEVDAFKEYARIWIGLINRLGGQHHGYFLPMDDERSASHRGGFSFSSMGSEGPRDVAVALFSFPDWAAYEFYRSEAGRQEECKVATELVERTKCFTSYERTFMTPFLGW